MKYDPVSLFDISITTDDDGNPHVDLAVSMPLLTHVCESLGKIEGDIMTKDELITQIAGSIIEFAYEAKRKN